MSAVEEPEALAARLFTAHGARVRAFLRTLTGRAALAEDLAQDVFVRVVRGAADYDSRGRDQPGFSASPGMWRPTSLTEALGALPRHEREAFLPCEIGGLSYAEIAAVLETTIPAVRSLLYRARLKLRDGVIPTLPVPPARVRSGDPDDDQ